ncbi:hypothetical protein F5Y12DRAFT_799177 [Xylaria sp. FL1777]|nr:hypothetical protein F5Y12DRAFT_799177 [Xylaria sp. FL1777]
MLSINLSNYSPEEQDEIMNGPALPPPPGVVPDFNTTQRWNSLGIFTNVACLIITLTVIGLRAYAKIVCVKKLRLEDYMIPIALAAYIGCIYCDISMIHFSGLFVHQWDIRMKDLGTIMFFLHAGANLCASTIVTLKAAILLEWIRIFVPPGTRNYFFWIGSVLLIVHTLFYVGWIITENLSCVPHRKIWDITIWEGRCIDGKLIYIPVAAINLIADIIILVLPQRAIWTLHMSTKKKFGVALVFTIGSLACLSAGVRLHVTLVYYGSEDVVFTESGMYLWALVEMTCLFLVFCVPSIPRVFVDKGIKVRIKSLLSWCTRRTQTADEDSSQPSLQMVLANRPRSGAYQPRQETLSSVDMIWGPTTEITAAGAHDDHICEGVTGILRTREFTAEVTTAVPDLSKVEGTEEAAHEKHQRVILH